MASRSGRSRSGGSSGSKQSTRRSSGGRSSARASSASERTDKSVEAFRDALERSVTLTRGRQYTDDLVKQLERLLDQAMQELDTRVAPARRRATTVAGRAARAARDAADEPLARADRIRRRAGVTAGGPITAYDQLTANQVKSRLKDLSPPELRQVRAREKRGKARKGVLDEIERRLK